jgi:NAD(P)H-dependent flavin oxidoreductase YrpB (nitropropane dioxygenase family)
MSHPVIIQGGMGVGVSGWRLARAVASAGQLGVVSGTALDVQLARRLQLGDPGGHLRRALASFPDQEMVGRALRRFFVPDGIGPAAPFARLPRPAVDMPRELVELTVLGNFAEVFLAREGHDGPVGINYLEKIQLPTLAALHGALLAGVGYVLMGAGIPLEIPGALAALCRHQPVSLALDVSGQPRDQAILCRFDPATVAGPRVELRRPFFLPIISSASLAQVMLRRASGAVDGFVVEGPMAGGHNAPPRGPAQVDALGQPVYGPRDEVDLAKVRALGRPFWLAGGRGRAGMLEAAQAQGATGIQVGTAFAFCRESGLPRHLREAVIAQVLDGAARVHTDPLASPTGFPFKVVQLPGTLSQPELLARRRRLCDLGYLRELYRRGDGAVGYRCPAEPEAAYRRKGGAAGASRGRKCLCNALVANLELGQRRAAGAEPPLLTAGDDLAALRPLAEAVGGDYGAAEVLDLLLGSSHGDPVALGAPRAAERRLGETSASRLPPDSQKL